LFSKGRNVCFSRVLIILNNLFYFHLVDTATKKKIPRELKALKSDANELPNTRKRAAAYVATSAIADYLSRKKPKACRGELTAVAQAPSLAPKDISKNNKNKKTKNSKRGAKKRKGAKEESSSDTEIIPPRRAIALVASFKKNLSEESRLKRAQLLQKIKESKSYKKKMNNDSDDDTVKFKCVCKQARKYIFNEMRSTFPKSFLFTRFFL